MPVISSRLSDILTFHIDAALGKQNVYLIYLTVHTLFAAMGGEVHSYALLREMIHLNTHVYCSGQVSLMATRSLHNYAGVLRATA